MPPEEGPRLNQPIPLAAAFLAVDHLEPSCLEKPREEMSQCKFQSMSSASMMQQKGVRGIDI